MRRLSLLLLILISFSGTIAQTNNVPVISSPSHIDVPEYAESLDFTWYVYDDNLKLAEIFNQGILLLNYSFTADQEGFQNHSISTQFQIGEGEYKFILSATDHDNNTSNMEISVTKGNPNREILTLPYLSSIEVLTFLVIVMFARYIPNRIGRQHYKHKQLY